MIVGTKEIPINKLREACISVASLKAFSLSLVPRCLQHVTEVVDNQCYLVAIEVKNLDGINFKKKQALSEGLLHNVVVKGTINTLIDFEDLVNYVDMDSLFKELFKNELKAYDKENNT